MGQQWVGDKLLPEIRQIAVHKAHLLSQWAISKVRWHCKIEKQSANQHNMLTAKSQLMDLWPCPRERAQGKETAPNKPTQWKPNSKAGQLVGHWADLQNLRTSHTLLREELTKQLTLKDKKKNWWVSPTTWLDWKSFCLNTNTRTGCWKSNTTTKTEIILFLNLKFFFGGGSLLFFLVFFFLSLLC
jgi:hypothetical protein